MSAKLQGFVADHSLIRSTRSYRQMASGGRSRLGVRLAQDSCQECWQPCINDCRQSGELARNCVALCRAECGCQPRDPGTIGCTPRDNSINNSLCLGAIAAWEAACGADCAVLLGPIPIVGGALAAACSEGCRSVAGQSRSSCPPPV